jgi:hypothetical protein
VVGAASDGRDSAAERDDGHRRGGEAPALPLAPLALSERRFELKASDTSLLLLLLA